MREPADLVVGRRADVVRRKVGATAWAVLEALTARSEFIKGELTVVANVRETAAVVGLSKNAAHRAIRRLVQADIATPCQRRAGDGRYLTGRYRLTIPPDVLAVTPLSETATVPVTPHLPRPRRRRATDNTGQLDLLLDAG